MSGLADGKRAESFGEDDIPLEIAEEDFPLDKMGREAPEEELSHKQYELMEELTQGGLSDEDKFLSELIDVRDFLHKSQLFLGRYQILELIGEGNVGVVYKIKDIKINRYYALKSLKKKANNESEQRFLTEVKSLAKIQYPSIIKVNYAGKSNGKLFLIMDYIEGFPLSKSIVDQLSFEKKLSLFIKVVEGIHHCHQNHIIHRDLKPANIMVNRNGHPIVMDFGLAKELNSCGSDTAMGMILGTPVYMAPEQAEGEISKIDHLSDVYALGVILFELLTGKKPFEGPSSFATMLKVLHEDPPLPSEINPSLSPQIEGIIFKAMEKKKENRYQSARELAIEVKRFLAGKSVQAKKNSGWTRWQRKIKRSKTWTAFTAFLQRFSSWQQIKKEIKKLFQR